MKARLLAIVVATAACGPRAGTPDPTDPTKPTNPTDPTKPKTGPGPKKPAPPKSVQLNAPGASVNIDAALVPGYVVVVDFWMESCGACKVVGKMLDEGTAKEPRILIRKVDVGDAFTPVAEAYEIGALPHYRVFDKKGRMRYLLVGNDCTKATQIAKELLAEP